MYTFPYLKRQDVQIFKDGHSILTGISKDYPKQNTGYILGKSVLKEEDEQEYEVDYEWLRSRGIIIAKKRCLKDIHNNYSPFVDKFYLTFYSTSAEEIGEIPRSHKVKFNNLQRVITLIGPLVRDDKVNVWSPIDRNWGDGRKKKVTDDDYLEDLFPENVIPKQDEFKKVKYMVWGITREGELLCIPKLEDTMVAAAVGKRGSGKTMLAHRAKDTMVETNYAYVIEFNDRKYDTTTYIEEWQEHEFCSDDLSLINEFSKPLPMLYLYPNSEKLNNEMIEHNNEVAFTFSIPFDELIKDTKSFETYDLWQLGKSLKYLEEQIYDDETGEELKDGLLFKKSITEIKKLFKDNMKSNYNPAGIPESSVKRINSVLTNMWNKRFVDLSNGINAKWKIKMPEEKYEIETYPWVVGMMAKLSVSVMTPHIIHEDYFPFLFRFLMNSTFAEKGSKDSKLSDMPLIFFSDEVHDLLKIKEAMEIVDESAKTGRSVGAGNFLITQHSDEIPSSIKTNITHWFVFQQDVDDEVINKKLKKYPSVLSIKNKLKSRWCIAIGDFMLIDPVNGKEYSNKGRPVIMKVLPPNSRHKPPTGYK